MGEIPGSPGLLDRHGISTESITHQQIPVG